MGSLSAMLKRKTERKKRSIVEQACKQRHRFKTTEICLLTFMGFALPSRWLFTAFSLTSHWLLYKSYRPFIDFLLISHSLLTDFSPTSHWQLVDFLLIDSCTFWFNSNLKKKKHLPRLQILTDFSLHFPFCATTTSNCILMTFNRAIVTSHCAIVTPHCAFDFSLCYFTPHLNDKSLRFFHCGLAHIIPQDFLKVFISFF